MERRKQGAALAAMLVALAIGIHASQVWLLDHARTTGRPLQKLQYLPQGDYLRVAAIGYIEC